ncbi:MAG: hypothetical protein JSU70_21945 [Phycisphaerales bacterium]|nr:MAG: hypothetical protein JSU70_21945 [Phycisphaerales bacterium]
MRCLTQTVLLLAALGLTLGISAAPQQPQQGSDEQASETARRQLSILRKETEDALARAQTQALLQVARNATPQLVIPSPHMEPEGLTAIAEDMSIMYRILEKRLQSARLLPEDSVAWFQHYPDFHRQRARPIASVYLDGYGAIFFIEVPFPLSRPPSPERPSKPEEDLDPIWARVREEMYDPEAATRKKDDQAAKQFDPEQVENLKRTLLKALIHAANIRFLKPSEYTTLMVAGSSPASEGMYLDRYTLLVNGKRTPAPPTATDSARSANLIIRAKKADADAYLKDQLDFESFYKKAEILISQAYFRPLARRHTTRAVQ